ncbi:MAG: cell division protein SepF [Acidimicrobiales bacterium]
MASMWRKAMLYLGLGPDDEYDDFDVTGEHPGEPHSSPSRSSGRRSGSGSVQHDPEPSGSVRTLAPDRHGDDRNGNGHGASRGEDLTGEVSPGREPVAARRGSDVGRSGRGRRAVVRAMAPGATTKPFVVGPTSFNDAQDVADKFKVNVPVILNLQGVDRDLSRRIIDFASGLCYGLGGQMERVANQVYLLTPNDVEVSLEERRRLRERGYEA